MPRLVLIMREYFNFKLLLKCSMTVLAKHFEETCSTFVAYVSSTSHFHDVHLHFDRFNEFQLMSELHSVGSNYRLSIGVYELFELHLP